MGYINMSGNWTRLNYDNCKDCDKKNNYYLSVDPYQLNLGSKQPGISNLWSNENIKKKIDIENELFSLTRRATKCVDDKHKMCDLDFSKNKDCPNLQCCNAIPVVPALNEREIVKTNMKRLDKC